MMTILNQSKQFDIPCPSIIKAELKKIEDSTPIDKIKKFFEQNIGWNDEKIAEAGFTKEELSDYADHELGTQILNCLEEQGQCNFLGQI